MKGDSGQIGDKGTRGLLGPPGEEGPTGPKVGLLLLLQELTTSFHQSKVFIGSLEASYVIYSECPTCIIIIIIIMAGMTVV